MNQARSLGYFEYNDRLNNLLLKQNFILCYAQGMCVTQTHTLHEKSLNCRIKNLPVSSNVHYPPTRSCLSTE